MIGALCKACRVAKMSRYREKIVIRIIGQPLLTAKPTSARATQVLRDLRQSSGKAQA